MDDLGQWLMAGVLCLPMLALVNQGDRNWMIVAACIVALLVTGNTE